MRRLGGPVLLYALVAVLALAAPIAVSEEAPPADQAATATTPAAATPAAPAPAGEAPAPAATAPAAPAQSGAPSSAAPTDGTPAPSAPAQSGAPASAAPAAPAAQPAAAEQTITDDAPVAEAAKKSVVAKAAASTSVTISDFKFSPGGITVNVGDTVTWNNSGPTAHSATANDGSFDTGILSKGGSGSHTFTQAGTFSYICTPHPFMKGTVTVVAAAADNGGGSDTGSSDTGTGSTGDTTASGTADDGSGLPSTGLDVGGIAVLGLATLALGAFLRRRTALQPARPAGRIGW